MPPSLSSRKGTSRRGAAFGSQKLLLVVFVSAAVLVAISILLMPNIEDATTFEHPGMQKATSKAESEQLGDLLEDLSLRQEARQAIQAHHLSEVKLKTGVVVLPLKKDVEDRPLEPKQDVQAAPLISGQEPSKKRTVKYHVVFSTGCSTFQDWQSYVLFHNFLQSGQEGKLTRIASGCKDQDTEDIKKIFKEKFAVMAPDRFSLHLTPDFSRVKPGLNFKYFNKPFGMQHWLTNALGYPGNHVHDDTIIILMDPDQLILRPFTNDFSNSTEVWKIKNGYKLKVEHGAPFAQQYGFALQWLDKVKMDHIAPDSPVVTMPRGEAQNYYYAMGPPYIATAKDMFAIVTKWCEFVPKIYDDYPHLLAEMFGYNLAAAHLELRHTIAHSFMVSDAGAGGEGWKLIDKVGNKDVCGNYPKELLPHVLHYCQRYFLGKWFIGKYKLRKDFISCEAPLLAVPPPDIGVKYNYHVSPNDQKKETISDRQVKYNAFMLCTLIPALNDAAIYYKDHHCDKATANYDRTYTFFEDMSTPEDGM
jgi:hypothetical protein